MVKSPSGQGSSDHPLVETARRVSRSSSGVRDRRANHSTPSTAIAATLRGLKVPYSPLVSGDLLITLLLLGPCRDGRSAGTACRRLFPVSRETRSLAPTPLRDEGQT